MGIDKTLLDNIIAQNKSKANTDVEVKPSLDTAKLDSIINQYKGIETTEDKERAETMMSIGQLNNDLMGGQLQQISKNTPDFTNKWAYDYLMSDESAADAADAEAQMYHNPLTTEETLIPESVVVSNKPQNTLRGAGLQDSIKSLYDAENEDFLGTKRATASHLVDKYGVDAKGYVTIGDQRMPRAQAEMIMQDVVEQTMHPTMLQKNKAYRDNWFIGNTGMNAEDYLRSIDANLAGLQRELNTEVGKDIDAIRSTTTALQMAENAGIDPTTAQAIVTNERYGGKAIRDMREQIQSILNNDFSSGLKEGFDALSMISAGLNDLVANVELGNVLNKVYNDKPLTEREKIAYEAHMIGEQINELEDLFGSRSWWNEVGQGVGTSAEMAVGFAAGMGAVGKLGKFANLPVRAAIKSVRRAAKSGAWDAIKMAGIRGTQLAGRSLKNVVIAEGAGLIAAPMLPSTYASLAEKRNGQYAVENGRLVFKPTTAWRDVVDTWIESGTEIGSELIGARIGEVLGGSARAFGRMLSLDKLAAKAGIGKHSNILFGWEKPAAFKAFERRVGFQGAVAEPLSEIWGDAAANMLKGIITGNGEFAQFGDVDYWTKTLATCAIYGGSLQVASAPHAVARYANIASKGRERMRALSRIKVAKLHDEVSAALAIDNIDDAAKAFASINWGEYTADQRGYAMDAIRADYAQRVAIANQIEDGRMTQFLHVADRIEDMEYRGMDGLTPKGFIKTIVDKDGVTYTAIQGGKDKPFYICLDANGNKVSIPTANIVSENNIALGDVISQQYDSMYSVESEQERQRNIVDRYNDMRKGESSAESIKNIMSLFGVKQYHSGDDVTLVNGEAATVEEFIPETGEFIVSLHNGGMETLPFYNILSESTLTADAQKLNNASAVTANVETQLDAEERGEETANEPRATRFVEGDIVITPTGEKARVREVNEDGTYEVDMNTEEVANPSAMVLENYAEADLRFEDERVETPPAEVIEPEAEVAEVEQTAPESNVDATMPEAKPIPQNEDGTINYDAIDDAEQFATLYEREVGGRENAIQDVADMRDSAQEDLLKSIEKGKKMRNANEKVANRREQQALAERVAFYNKVLDILAPTEQTTSAEGTAPSQSAEAEGTQTGLIANDLSAQLTEDFAASLDVVAKAFVLRVKFVHLVSEGKANAEIEGNEVRIAWKYRGKAIPFLVGHEFTHRMQDLSPEEYNAFKGAVIKYLGEEVWNARIADVKYSYDKQGIRYTDALIEDEVIADFVGELIEEADSFDLFVAQNAKEGWFKRFIEALKAIFSKLAKTDVKAELYNDMLGKLNTMVTKATEVASKQITVSGSNRKSVMENGNPSLVGVHNISLDKLRKVIKMGGLANPSVAVIDVDKQTHDDYGEYSLVLSKNMVDARTGKNAGTWAGDAWTPTYPPIIKRMRDSKAMNRYYKDTNAMPKEMVGKIRLAFDSFMEGRSANALSYWYLFEKGKSPEMIDVPSRYPADVTDALYKATNGSFNMYGLTAEERAKCLDVLIAYKYDGDKAAYDAEMQERIERLKDTLETKKSDRVKKWAQDNINEINEYGFDYDELSRFIRDVEVDVLYKGDKDVDATIRAAQDYITENNLEADYEEWLSKLENRYGVEEYIFDGYTNSGDRKYLLHTVENASKWMKKQGREGAVATFPSFGVFVATVIPKMTSLESIRKRKELLGKSKEEYDAFRDKWDSVYFELGKELQPDAKGFEDYGYWRLIEAVGHKNPMAFIKSEYGIELTEAGKDALNKMVDAIRNEYPARYFETKFERPLQLGDFTAAVVPNDIPLDVESRLKDAGVEVIEYEKGDNASRAEAMQKASAMENVRFSLQETNERFNAELAMQISGTLPKGHIYKLGMPSEVLRFAGVENLPIELTANNLQLKASESYKSNHPFELGEVKNLVFAIQMPIAIFDSEEQNGRKVILTELKNKKGDNFIAIVDVRKIGGRNYIEINSIISLYPKDSAVRIAKWFDSERAKLTEKGKETLLKWVDKEKALKWLASHSSNVNAAGLSPKRIANIIQKKYNEYESARKNAKFSLITPEMDADYLSAVERGDMATAQQMVMEAAKLAMPNTKVVDENGNPKVVYHGTGSEFYTFRKTSDINELGAGYYFSDSYEMAERYATDETLADNRFRVEALAFDIFTDEMGHSEEDYDDIEFEDDYNESSALAVKRLFGNGRVMSVFLNIENPRILSRVSPDFDPVYQYGFNYHNEGVMAKRYNDGVIDEMFTERHNNLTGNQYVVFNSNQIKSADPVTYDDNGNIIPLSERFNPENEDIRYSIQAPTFYSNAEFAVLNIKQDKATPEQWLKMIEKAGGLKASEDKWLGLSDWLKASDKKTLTKDEVLQYIADNNFVIEEVEYSDVEDSEDFKKLYREYNALYYEFGRNSERAFEAMEAEYGDDFGIAFESAGDELWVRDSEAAESFVNINGVNDTRLQYTTDGLNNKREIALVVPSIEPYNQSDTIHFGDAGDGRAVAWIRFGETTDAEGNRVLVIDEIQSKRHQDGREKGYRDETAYKREKAALDEQEAELFQRRQQLIKKLNEKYGSFDNYLKRETHGWRTGLYPNEEVMTPEEIAEYNATDLESNIAPAARQLKEKYLEGIPSAPFEKNWAELAMKRMLRYAAENGFDYVAWTTGDQQAERYNIGNVVSRILSYDGQVDGNEVKHIELHLTDRSRKRMAVDANGVVVSSEGDFVKAGTPFTDVVGKEVARKVLDGEGEDATLVLRDSKDGVADAMMQMMQKYGVSRPADLSAVISAEDKAALDAYNTQREVAAKEIEGEGLRIGGNGMKAFYDQMLPSFVKKYTKKWGAEVGEVTMPDLEENNTMHAVNVTDAMRESVMQGQPKFSLKDELFNEYAAEVDSLKDEFSKIDPAIIDSKRLYRAHKREVIQRYADHIADVLNLPCESFAVDNNDDSQIKDAYYKYMRSHKEWATQHSASPNYIPMREFVAMVKNRASVAAYIPESTLTLLFISETDGYDTSAKWLETLLHENTHKIIETLGISDFEKEGVYNEAKRINPKSVAKIDSGYPNATIAERGEEVIAFAIEGRLRAGEVLLDYLEGRKDIKDVLDTYKYNVPLRNQVIRKVIRTLKDGYERSQNESRGASGIENNSSNVRFRGKLADQRGDFAGPRRRYDRNGREVVSRLSVRDADMVDAKATEEEYKEAMLIKAQELERTLDGEKLDIVQEIADQTGWVHVDNDEWEYYGIGEVALTSTAKEKQVVLRWMQAKRAVHKARVRNMYRTLINEAYEGDDAALASKYETERAEAIARIDAEYADKIEAFEEDATPFIKEYYDSERWAESVNIVNDELRKMRKKIEAIADKERTQRTDALGKREAVAAIKTQINNLIRGDLSRYMRKRDIQALMKAVNDSQSAYAMLQSVDNAMRTIYQLRIRKEMERMNNLTKMRIVLNETNIDPYLFLKGVIGESAARKLAENYWRGVNSSGVNVEKGVDADTAAVMQFIHDNIDYKKVKGSSEIFNVSEYISSLETKINEDVTLDAEMKTKKIEALPMIADYLEIQQMMDDFEVNYNHTRMRSSNIAKLTQKITTLNNEIKALESTSDKVIASENQLKDRRKALLKARKELRSEYRAVLSERIQNDDMYFGTMPQIVERLYQANKAIEDTLRKGRLELSLHKSREEAHKKEIINDALKDMDGYVPATDEPVMQRVAKVALGVVTTPFHSLDYLTREMAKYSTNGEGRIWRRFAPTILAASNNIQANMRDIAKQMDDKAESLFDMSYAKMRRLAERTQIGTYPVRKFVHDGVDERGYMKGKEKVVEMPLYVCQALDILATWGQENGRQSLEKMGFDEEIIDRITRALDENNPQWREYSSWVINSLLPSRRPKLNAAHKKVFGAPMAAERNYFPIRRDKDLLHKDEDIANDGLLPLPSVVTGSVIARTNSTANIDLNVSFFDVLEENLTETEAWSEMAPIIKDLNILLSSTPVKLAMKNIREDFVTEFRKAAKVATLNYTSEYGEFDKWVVPMINKAWATSKLALKGYTSLKQLSGTLLFLPYAYDPRFRMILASRYLLGDRLPISMIMGDAEVNMKKLLEIRVDKLPIIGNVMWAMEHSVNFRNRVLSATAGNETFAKKIAEAKWHDKNWVTDVRNILDKAMNYSMLMIAGVDAFTVAGGMRAIYDYETLILNTPKEKAMLKAEFYANKTQQSAEPLFLAPMQQSRSFFAQVFSTFQNAPIAQGRIIAESLMNLIRNSSKTAMNTVNMKIEDMVAAQLQEEDAGNVMSTQQRGERAREIEKQIRETVFEKLLKDALSEVKASKKTSISPLLWNAYLAPLAFNLTSILPYLIFGDDEDRKKDLVKDVFAWSWAGPFASIPVLSQLIQAAQGYDFSLSGAYDNFTEDVQRVIDHIGTKGIDWGLAGIVLDTALRRVMGLDYQTVLNVAQGIDSMIEDGYSHEALMKLINAPDSQIRLLAGERREGETVIEYTERILRLYSIGEYSKYEDYFNEKGQYIGPDNNLLKMRSYRAKRLLSEYNEAYKRSVVRRLGERGELTAMEKTDAKYTEKAKSLNWNAEAAPSHTQNLIRGEYRAPVDDLTIEGYSELAGLQNAISNIAKNMKGFAGSDEVYYDMAKILDNLKQKFNSKYDEFIK